MPTIDPDFEKQLEGYALATAEIFYRLPDAQNVLQSYLWQDYDIAPKFPVLRKFLTFWKRELDGPIHSVRLAHAQLMRPAELRVAAGEFHIH